MASNHLVKPAFSMSTKSVRANAVNTLKASQAVCFDVDSCVIQEEGIDVLAASLGFGDQVAEITKRFVNYLRFSCN
jgi:hypothetical protein